MGASIIVLFAPSLASAEESDTEDTFVEEGPNEEDAASDAPRVAIQRPKYQMAHELRLALGVMPLDAFQKGYTGSLSYTLHFGYVAWEVFQVTAAHLTSTDLRDELIDTFAIPEDDFNAPRFMATTGIEIAPIYGKQAFLNDDVFHQGVLLGVHAGVIFGDRGKLSETLSDLRPAVGAGIGYRLFLSKTVSARIDFRDFISFRRAIQANDRAEVENVLLITGSISMNLWRDDA